MVMVGVWVVLVEVCGGDGGGDGGSLGSVGGSLWW